MYHNNLQVTPGQLMFGRDMILNTPYIADWGALRRLKQQLIDKNNKTKYKNRKLHSYKVPEKVLVHEKMQKNTRIRIKSHIQSPRYG